MLILGIESSCDETSASLVSNGNELLSNVISSQNEIHAKYGGIVPEIASRKHMEMIIPVVREALSKAKKNLKDLDGIAVTMGPGLIGSLLVGLSTAKSISFCNNIPLIGVNHLHAHLCSILLENDPAYPCIGLIVSGGHTSLYLCESPTDMKLLGKTQDDAAGEVFDKVAKFMGLPYPGGIEIEKIAKGIEDDDYKFPRPMLNKKSFNFSFSGLKTSVINTVRRFEGKLSKNELKKIAASFQMAIVDTLCKKLKIAMDSTGCKSTIICGGVAANTRLREQVKLLSEKNGYNYYIPSKVLCTDNAAMIAACGSLLLKEGKRDSFDLNASSNLEKF